MNNYYWNLDESFRNPSEYLEHFGIHGMKWGVRRFQDESGQYTAEGEARYADRDHGNGPAEHHRSDSEGVIARRQYGSSGLSRTSHKNSSGKNILSSVQNASQNLKRKISDATHSRVTDKQTGEKTFTRHKTNLVGKYMEQGMSREDAEKAADKKINTERAIAAAAAVTVAVAATTVAVKKYHDYTRDEHIDVPLQRIVAQGTDEDLNAYTWYGSYKSTDKIKYAGTMANSIRRKSVKTARDDIAANQLKDYWKSKGFSDDDAKAKALEEVHTVFRKAGDPLPETPLSNERAEAVKSAMKTAKAQVKDMNFNPEVRSVMRNKGYDVASDEKARKTFAKLFKNDAEFRQDVLDTAAEGAKQWGTNASGGKKRVKAYNALLNSDKNTSERKLMKDAYNAFNTNITTRAMHGEKGASIMNKYAAELKKQGANAIQDYNDMHQSRYHSSKPVIVMPDVDATYAVTSRTMSDIELKGKGTVGNFMIGKAAKETVAGLVAVTGVFTLKAIHDTQPVEEGSKEVTRIANIETRNSKIQSMRASGKSIDEISNSLDIPVGTVKSVLYSETV